MTQITNPSMPDIEKLEKLLSHMEGVKDEAFYFGRVRCCVEQLEPDQQEKHHSCKTVGCMMGEFPLVFPEHYYYSGFEDNYVASKDANGIRASAMKLLGIGVLSFGHLFLPKEQLEGAPYFTIMLKHESTRKEVIDNLKAFIDYYKAKGNDSDN